VLTKTKFRSIIYPALLIANLTVTLLIVLYLFVPNDEQPYANGTLAFDTVKNGQYILYIGTNDKDTYEQVISTADAINIVNSICAKYVDGYTVSKAKGGWIDEKGILTQENTLVYTFTGVKETEIVAIMREILIAMNQNSILVERKNVSKTFFNGKD